MRLPRSLAFAFLLLAATARADDGASPPAEPPAKPPEAAPAKPADTPAKPADAPAKPADAPAEAPAQPPADPAATPPVETPKLRTPKEAWETIQKAMRQGRSGQGPSAADQATEYLREWEAAGGVAEGPDRLLVGRLQATAGRQDDAADTWRALFADAAVADDLRDDARIAFVQEAAQRFPPKDPTEAHRARLVEAEKVVLEIRPSRREQRGLARNLLAMAQERAGRPGDALASSMAAVVDRPALAGTIANRVVGDAIEHAHDFPAYAAVRSTGKPFVALLRATFEAQQAAAPAPAPGAEDGAAWVRKALLAADASLDLLGNPLPDWTVKHSFRGGASPKDYRGKVVLVDFWATWCPWCIKSFPAMRDLRKEFGEKGFVVLGVTAPASNVYESRYDLDDDMKAKAAEGEKHLPLRMKQRGSEAETAEFREKEVAAIEKFVANHEIPWDVTMIADEEVGPRFGVTGWPTGILVDKKGRVRAIHSGALQREKPEGLVEIRKLIEALLAEPE